MARDIGSVIHEKMVDEPEDELTAVVADRFGLIGLLIGLLIGIVITGISEGVGVTGSIRISFSGFVLSM